MDKTDAPAETRIDLEGLEQQLRTDLWEQPGVYAAKDADADTAVDMAPEEQSVDLGEGGPGRDTSSTPTSVQALVKDRDPKGVNKCLKVIYFLPY